MWMQIHSLYQLMQQDDGSLTLTIPRSVLDATINGEDDDFFVLIDGEEVRL